MKDQIIKVTIDKNGEAVFELEGFVGDECNAIEEIEAQMGYDVQREDTEERLYEIPDPNFLNIG